MFYTAELNMWIPDQCSFLHADQLLFTLPPDHKLEGDRRARFYLRLFSD
jgi:hypothetical protein